jgi:hypothetical protein
MKANRERAYNEVTASINYKLNELTARSKNITQKWTAGYALTLLNAMRDMQQERSLLLEALEFAAERKDGNDGCLETDYCLCWRCKARVVIAMARGDQLTEAGNIILYTEKTRRLKS